MLRRRPFTLKDTPSPQNWNLLRDREWGRGPECPAFLQVSARRDVFAVRVTADPIETVRIRLYLLSGTYSRSRVVRLEGGRQYLKRSSVLINGREHEKSLLSSQPLVVGRIYYFLSDQQFLELTAFVQS